MDYGSLERAAGRHGGQTRAGRDHIHRATSSRGQPMTHHAPALWSHAARPPSLHHQGHGVWNGTASCLLGAAIAASVSFVIGKTILRGYVERVLEDNPKFQSID